MKTLLVVVGLSIALSGCGFLLGAGAGALGTGAYYEYSSGQELERLEQDYQRGRVTHQEYEARKEEIGRGSLVY